MFLHAMRHTAGRRARRDREKGALQASFRGALPGLGDLVGTEAEVADEHGGFLQAHLGVGFGVAQDHENPQPSLT